MSDENTEEATSKKGKGKVKKAMIGLLVILILGGGGAAGGYFAAGMVGNHETPISDPDQPKLVSKDGKDIAANLPLAKVDTQKIKRNESAFKATYYPIEAPFTSNLKDSSSFAQMSLAVATYYDERVLENIQEHETAIRSAILMTLAEQDTAVLSTQQGKETLQGLLTTAINKVLQEKTGFGGIDNVYFTSFLVQ